MSRPPIPPRDASARREPGRRVARPRQACARSQRGAALLMAMIIVTLVITLAAGMVWQQWRAVQVEAAERARVQAAWILTGALDWARLILREDARTGGADHLGEPWAVPLAEARLSTFLAADKDNTDDAPDAFLSGRIVDEHSRFNLSNLVDAGKILPDQLEALERLCQALGVAVDVAKRIAEGLRDASEPMPGTGTGTNATAPLLPRDVAQLAWFGVSGEALARLEPHVTLLPTRTLINANTASREVLVASIKGLDLASAENLLQMRQRSHFKTPADVLAQIPGLAQGASPPIGVVSNFFEVRGRLRLGDRVLEHRSVVERRGLDVVLLQREQVASREAAGP
jgi:general secretion pathway protein K